MTTNERLRMNIEAAKAAAPGGRRPMPATAPARSWIRDVQWDPASLALGGFILWFAGIHLRLWILHPGVFVGLGQVALELLQGGLFFVRRRAPGKQRNLSVWAATTIGSWGFLLARPAGAGLFNSDLLFTAQPLFGAERLWLGVQLMGTLLAILSLSSLGRSWGLLAANRGVRTGGAYRIVRHPAYASYFIVQFAYLLENLSLWNLGLFCIVLVAQLVRIQQEEAVLVQDAAYSSYCRTVRYRLIPGLY